MEKEVRPEVGILITDEIGNQAEVIVLNPDDIRWLGLLQAYPGKIGIGLEVGLPVGTVEMAHPDEVMKEGPESPVGKTVVVVADLLFR